MLWWRLGLENHGGTENTEHTERLLHGRAIGQPRAALLLGTPAPGRPHAGDHTPLARVGQVVALPLLFRGFRVFCASVILAASPGANTQRQRSDLVARVGDYTCIVVADVSHLIYRLER